MAYSWKTYLTTATGEPQQFWCEGEELFLIAAEREGGPGDESGIPRRVVGTGPERASARRSLEATIRAYDPSWSVFPSRQTRSDAVRTRR